MIIFVLLLDYNLNKIILMYTYTPCLAGPQPQGSGPSPGPLPVIFIHTVECKIDGPLNYQLRNFAVLQIFEVKFAKI